MTYKETLFFIGKSLTINHVEQNKKEIEIDLKNQIVDWDAVVKVSTAHYVFPALYCNYQRADFLKYLPDDLVAYMQHITDLNRERNQQIIAQAKEINDLLVANNITPIFLKGTGNLLEGLYEDIAERMVGDIDFLVSKKEYYKTIEVLKEFGYEKKSSDSFEETEFKHYPKMTKNSKNCIASIEIHKELINEKYAKEFNYSKVINDIQQTNNIWVLGYSNQLNLSILAKQINELGFEYYSFSLRNAYDVFLFSNKVNSLESIQNFKHLYEPMNCFLAVCFQALGKSPTI